MVWLFFIVISFSSAVTALSTPLEKDTDKISVLIKDIEHNSQELHLLHCFKDAILQACIQAGKLLEKTRFNNEDIYHNSVSFLSLIPSLLYEKDTNLINNALEEWLDEYEKGVFNGKSIDKKALFPMANIIISFLPLNWKKLKKYPRKVWAECVVLACIGGWVSLGPIGLLLHLFSKNEKSVDQSITIKSTIEPELEFHVGSGYSLDVLLPLLRNRGMWHPTKIPLYVGEGRQCMYAEDMINISMYAAWKACLQRTESGALLSSFSSDLCRLYPQQADAYMNRMGLKSILLNYLYYKKRKNAFLCLGNSNQEALPEVNESIFAFLSKKDSENRLGPLCFRETAFNSNLFYSSFQERGWACLKMFLMALWAKEENRVIPYAYKKKLFRWGEKEYFKKVLREWHKQYYAISQSYYQKYDESKEYNDLLAYFSKEMEKKKEAFKRYFFLIVRNQFPQYNSTLFENHLYKAFYSTQNKFLYKEVLVPVLNRGESEWRKNLMVSHNSSEFLSQQCGERRGHQIELDPYFSENPYFFHSEYSSFTPSERVNHYKKLIGEFFLEWFVRNEEHAQWSNAAREINFDSIQQKAEEWYEYLHGIEYARREVGYQEWEVTKRSFQEAKEELARTLPSVRGGDTWQMLEAWKELENPHNNISLADIFHSISLSGHTNGGPGYKNHYSFFLEEPFYTFHRTITSEVKRLCMCLSEDASLSEHDRSVIRETAEKYVQDAHEILALFDENTYELYEQEGLQGSFSSFNEWLRSMRSQEPYIRNAMQRGKEWYDKTQEALDKVFAITKTAENLALLGSHGAVLTNPSLLSQRAEEKRRRETDQQFRQSFIHACQELLDVPRGIDACRWMVSHEMERFEGTEEEKGVKACAYIFDPHQEKSNNERFLNDMRELYSILYPHNSVAFLTSTLLRKMNRSHSDHMQALVKQFSNLCEYLACHKALKEEPMPADEKGAYPYAAFLRRKMPSLR